MFYLVHGSTFSNKLNGSFRLSHKGVEAVSYVYKTESMNMTRRRGKGTATVWRSQRLPLPLPLAAGLACDLDFAGAFFFGRSESSESSPFP
jgi:hypothetical protein